MRSNINTSSLDWKGSIRLNNNKADVAKELLGLLKKELPIYQSKLTEAIRTFDLDELRFHCHKLQGACCYIAMPCLKKLTQQLQTDIQSNNKDRVVRLVQHIHHEIDEVMKQVLNIPFDNEKKK